MINYVFQDVSAGEGEGGLTHKNPYKIRCVDFGAGWPHYIYSGIAKGSGK